MSDLSHFEPAWEDIRQARADLAGDGYETSAVTADMLAAASLRARQARPFWRRRWDGLLGRPGPIIPECAHQDVARVVSGKETVAGLCRQCDTQLSVAWFTCQHADAVTLHADNKTIKTPRFGYSIRLTLRRCPACEAVWWSPRTYADWVSWL